MLFKQWNELSIPRHELDYPLLSTKEESLQSLPLPTISLPSSIDFQQFSKVILTTKVMNPLFPHTLLHLMHLCDLETSLSINEQGNDERKHSWNFNENFPDEFEPVSASDDNQSNINQGSKKSFKFNFPIYQIPNNNTLLISIDENFLKFSPIFGNMIAKELVNLIKPCSQISILGTSDKISCSKRLTPSDCSLVPPEFITGFIGSLLSEMITNNIQNFQGVIVPSEGPTGFEKISLTTMEELVDLFINEWNDTIDVKKYYDECHRTWKFDGAAMSTQSGLYI